MRLQSHKSLPSLAMKGSCCAIPQPCSPSPVQRIDFGRTFLSCGLSLLFGGENVGKLQVKKKVSYRWSVVARMVTGRLSPLEGQC